MNNYAANTPLPPVNIALNTLPTFWNRSCIFFVNLNAMFFGNNSQTEELALQITGVDHYGGRLLPILNILFNGKSNLLLLQSEPSDILIEYFKRDLGLTVPLFEIFNPNDYHNLPKTLLHNPNHTFHNNDAGWIEGFVTDNTLTQIATSLKKKSISTYEGSYNGNNKHLLHLFLQEQGLDVFDTITAKNKEEIIEALTTLKQMQYSKAVIKSQIGASGCGIIILPTEKYDPNDIKDYLFFAGPCMVQGWMDETFKGVTPLCSPSVQMFIDEENITLWDITDQLLSNDSVHQGNMSPPPSLNHSSELKPELLHQGTIASRWLHSTGYRGTASADFLVFQTDKKLKVIMCEINARVTGATYPAILCKYFNPNGAWVLKNFVFSEPIKLKALMHTMNEHHLLYKDHMQKGIIPYNIITDNQYNAVKGQFVALASNCDECITLLDQLNKVLPTVVTDDRD